MTKTMTKTELRINPDVYDGLVAHARREAPLEACGYLGEREGLSVRQYTMRNIDESGVHFTFDPQEQFDMVRTARAEGLKMAAVYHSHPATPARPSAEDIRLAYDPRLSYVVISLCQECPAVRSFRIVNGVATEQPISIVEQPDLS